MLAYHATTRQFAKFDINKTFKDSFFGSGFYFSDSMNDCITNYRDEKGPDNKSKIFELVDQMQDCAFDDEEELTEEECIQRATKIVIGDAPQLLVCELLMDNPAIMSRYGKNSYVELWQYDDDDEECAPTSKIYDYLIDAGLEEIWESIAIDGEMPITQLFNIICGGFYHLKDEGIDIYGVFIDILSIAGYDGIIMDKPYEFFGRMPDCGEKHYFLIDPDRVKILERIAL